MQIIEILIYSSFKKIKKFQYKKQSFSSVFTDDFVQIKKISFNFLK